MPCPYCRSIGGEDEACSTEGVWMFRLMYTLLCLLIVVVMLNVAITILSCYMAEVKLAGNDPKTSQFDRQLNDYVWERLQMFFSRLFNKPAKISMEANERRGGAKDMDKKLPTSGRSYGGRVASYIG